MLVPPAPVLLASLHILTCGGYTGALYSSWPSTTGPGPGAASIGNSVSDVLRSPPLSVPVLVLVLVVVVAVVVVIVVVIKIRDVNARRRLVILRISGQHTGKQAQMMPIPPCTADHTTVAFELTDRDPGT